MKFQKGNIPWNTGTKGIKKANSGSFKKGQVSPRKGVTLSEELKHKMSIAHKGMHNSPATEFKIGQTVGDKNAKWKGDDVGYFGLHDWIEKEKGKASYCSFDETHTSTRFHWANKSHKYKRDVEDWMQLCPKCHQKYDREKGWGIVKQRFL